MKSFTIAAALVALTAFFVPTPTLAYTTTGTVGFTHNNKTLFNAISFSFGHEKHAVHIPITARTDAKSRDALTYEILDADGGAAAGTPLGIVLSNAKVKGGEYVIPKGKSASFTLLTFFTPTSTSTEAYRTQVTNLPFTFDGKQELQLNPSELQYYTTKPVTLHASVHLMPVSYTVNTKR